MCALGVKKPIVILMKKVVAFLQGDFFLNTHDFYVFIRLLFCCTIGNALPFDIDHLCSDGAYIALHIHILVSIYVI